MRRVLACRRVESVNGGGEGAANAWKFGTRCLESLSPRLAHLECVVLDWRVQMI